MPIQDVCSNLTVLGVFPTKYTTTRSAQEMVVVEIGSGGRNANISRVPMEVVNSYKQEKKARAEV